MKCGENQVFFLLPPNPLSRLKISEFEILSVAGGFAVQSQLCNSSGFNLTVLDDKGMGLTFIVTYIGSPAPINGPAGVQSLFWIAFL